MGKYAKAITGALVTGLGCLQVGLDNGLTLQEGIGAAIATLVALGAVWGVPNSPVITTSVVDEPGRPLTTITTETKP